MKQLFSLLIFITLTSHAHALQSNKVLCAGMTGKNEKAINLTQKVQNLLNTKIKQVKEKIIEVSVPSVSSTLEYQGQTHYKNVDICVTIKTKTKQQFLSKTVKAQDKVQTKNSALKKP
jgi:hypothetical protein